MSLSVRTEGIAQRVIVSGGTGAVHAVSQHGVEWTVRQAGHGGAVVDPRAPVHQSIRYSDDESTVTAIRDPGIETAFTSIDGQQLVHFRLSHEWTYPVRPSAHVFRGAGGPLVVHGREPLRDPWQIRAVIAGAEFKKFESLVESQKRIVMLHNRSWCRLPHCPVPDVIVGYLTGVSGEVTGRKDVAQMAYRVQIDPIPLSRKLVVPARTWGDVAASHSSWADVAAVGSWADVRDGG